MADTNLPDEGYHSHETITMSLGSLRTIDVVWRMATYNIAPDAFGITIPIDLIQAIGSQGIEIMKARLCSKLGGPIATFSDGSRFHLVRVPSVAGMNSNLTAAISSEHGAGMPNAADNPATLASVVRENRETASPAIAPLSPKKKPFKAPRPPNAFILYRQHNHAILKAADPLLKNNDISVKLGQQWKTESDSVKAHWKARADELKQKHAIAYPNYQYAPRKPSEKKRRMTAAKFAKLAATSSNEPSSEEVTVVNDDDTVQGTHLLALSNEANQILNTGDIEITLPVSNEAAFANWLDVHNATIANYNPLPFDPDYDDQVTSSPSVGVEVDNDFFEGLVDFSQLDEDVEKLFGKEGLAQAPNGRGIF